jgi:hypothetical protein
MIFSLSYFQVSHLPFITSSFSQDLVACHPFTHVAPSRNESELHLSLFSHSENATPHLRRSDLPLKSFVTFQKHRQSSHDLITLKSWFNNFQKLYQETQSISKHEKKGNTNTKQARTKSVLPGVYKTRNTKRKQ